MITPRVVALALWLFASAGAQTSEGFNLTTSGNLPISFGSNRISAGQDVAVADTASPPTVYLPPGINRFEGYVLNLVDPDAPSPSHVLANVSEVLHWLQPDVDFSSGIGNWKAAPKIVPWLQSGPPTAEKHRYILLLFTTGSVHELLPEF
ncbi:MAG: hypothetical protein MMC23_009122 [Stictis urceolatum]|nr:hypothetical protein [Stictis urceolata]